jgi:cytochrome c biogenesis protein CcmG, thiol:disulfide interchange protein DsbE
MQEPASTTPPSRKVFGILGVPLGIFAALALMFAFALKGGDPAKLPSTLIGKKAPEINLPALEGLNDGQHPINAFTSADLANGKVSVVNFWASWCAPCVEEHPMLVALKEKADVTLFGINYKDQASAARRFLGRYTNPFAAVDVDAMGRAAIEWGVYGMPETFIINGRGQIIYKQVGPLTPAALESLIIPTIGAAERK